MTNDSVGKQTTGNVNYSKVIQSRLACNYLFIRFCGYLVFLRLCNRKTDFRVRKSVEKLNFYGNECLVLSTELTRQIGQHKDIPKADVSSTSFSSERLSRRPSDRKASFYISLPIYPISFSLSIQFINWKQTLISFPFPHRRNTSISLERHTVILLKWPYWWE